MKFSALARLERDVHRGGEIIGVFAKYGLADWFKGVHLHWVQARIKSYDGQHIPDLKVGERVRLAFAELGASFVKVGQMLSTRPDLVGPEIATELTQLQTAVPPDPPESVRATIEAELGLPLAEIFAEFDLTPIASASIAQVHLARLPTGEAVVVKVQHAGIGGKILADLDILSSLADLVEKPDSKVRLYQPAAIVRQVRRTLMRELDFTFERRHLDEFSQNFAEDETVYFPRTYPDFCSRRVLTMEFLEGVLGNEVEALVESGLDLNEFARRGANMYLNMIFRDRFYHADPHPGNLMLLPGSVIGVLDCGMVGRLDEETAETVDDMLMAVVDRNSSELAEILLRLGSAPPETPRDELRSELTDFVADHVGQSIHDIDIGGALTSILEIIRRHNITLPPALAMLLRTLIELDGTARKLSPEFSLAEVFRPFYMTMVRQRFSARRVLARLQHTYRDWERLAVALPRELGGLLKHVREGTFTVHLDVHRIDPVVNRLVMGVVSASLFVSSALMWSMEAPPLVDGVSVFGFIGFLLAVYLCWRVLRAIKKSGNIHSKK